jgi:putative transposase
MRHHNLLLERRVKQPGVQRRHEGRIAVTTSDTRWCSDGFEFRCDDSAKLSVTFALDYCDREAIGWVDSPTGYSGDDIRDFMLESVEKGFGDQLPSTPVQWLSDNGSTYIAEQTRQFTRQIGLQLVTTPVRSPQSNGMAESFVKTIKRDYVAHMQSLIEKNGAAQSDDCLRALQRAASAQCFEISVAEKVWALGSSINLTGSWCPV